MLRGANNLVARSKSGYVQAVLIARFYAHAAEKDLALDWLEKAYELGEFFLAYLNVDVDWDGLREEARFTMLLKRIGLVK